jgi:hypothetical protein
LTALDGAIVAVTVAPFYLLASDIDQSRTRLTARCRSDSRVRPALNAFFINVPICLLYEIAGRSASIFYVPVDNYALPAVAKRARRRWPAIA